MSKLYFMTSFYNSLIDDDNRIILNPIPGQQDCQNDYINASYLDVSIYSIMLSLTVQCYYNYYIPLTILLVITI